MISIGGFERRLVRYEPSLDPQTIPQSNSVVYSPERASSALEFARQNCSFDLYPFICSTWH